MTIIDDNVSARAVDLPLDERLAALLPPDAEMWRCGRLCGVLGTGVLVHEPALGLFAIADDSGHDDATRQAERFRDSLLNHLQSFTALTRSPWMRALAARPQQRHEDLPVGTTDRLVLADDLTDPVALHARLSRVSVAERHPRPTDHDLTLLRQALTDDPVRPSPRDVDRMGRILAAAASPDDELVGMLAPSAARRVQLTGPPGSGRTDDLLTVAVAHAARGRRVLLTCQHPVLRGELTRLLTASPDSVSLDLVTIATAADITIDPDHALGRSLFDTSPFDTVLVDEGEDYPLVAAEAIEVRCHRDADWFVSVGAGQDLHERSGRMPHATGTNWPHDHDHRNAGRLGLIGEAVRLHAPDRDAGVAFVTANATPPAANRHITRCAVPRVDRILEAENTSTDGRIGFLRRIIAAEHAAADGGSLAVLVARGSRSGAEAAWVRQALTDLDLAFVDQTELAGQHRLAPPERVRLVTMHHSRGIEADRVVVVGLGWLGGATPHDPVFGDPEAQRALGYVAMTRARRGLVVAHIPSPNMPAGYVDFVEAVTACSTQSARAAL